MGLGFALCMGLFDLIFEGSVNLWKSLFHMIFFGTTMTLVFELGHIYAYLRFLHPQYVLPLRPVSYTHLDVYKRQLVW